MEQPRFTGLALVLLTTLLFAVLPLPPSARAHDEACVWNGEKNTSWHDKDNWSSCAGGIPATHDDVRIPATPRSVVIDSLQSDVTVQNLTLQGNFLYVDVSKTLRVIDQFRAESGARIGNDGTIIGEMLVMPGSVEARGTFDGPITIAVLGTLKVTDRDVLVANDDLTVHGTLASPDSTVIFSGSTLTNHGTVSSNFQFRSNLPQTVVGSGAWTSPALSIGNGVAAAVALANPITLAVGRITMSHASILDIGGHTLGIDGPTLGIDEPTLASIGGGSRIVGSGTIRTRGAVTLLNGSGITPALDVAAGTTTASGSGAFEGPITVAAGTTLSIPARSILTAAHDLTLHGTLDGPSGTLVFTGTTFINNGVVAVPSVQFQGSEQTLSGTGSFSTTTTTAVGPDTRVTLASDHRMGKLIIRNRSTLDISGRTLRLAGAGVPVINAGTLLTPQSTVIFDGTAAQSVATSVAYHNLTLDNAAGVATEDGTLDVKALLKVAAGTFTSGACTCTDVQIDSGATLATNPNSAWSVTGDWNNAGGFTAGSGNTINFNGSDAQSITGPAETAFHNLTIANPNGATITVDARVAGRLTLDGDLRTGDRTLLMPNDATSAGGGDVFGTVKRSGPFAPGVAYTFGSPFVSLRFEPAGTLPSEITVLLREGQPAALTSAVNRKYQISQQDGSGWRATLRLHYRDSELNGQREGDLHLWRFDPAQSRWTAQTRAAANTTDNWIEHSGIDVLGEWGITARYRSLLPLLVRMP